MSETTQAAKRRRERPFAKLLQAQERFAKAGLRLDQARQERDDAIRNATAAGFTRRSVAEATGLTAGRVQQIIDRHR